MSLIANVSLLFLTAPGWSLTGLTETDEAPAWEDLEDEDLQQNLVSMARKQGDSADEDWLPYQDLKKRRKQAQNQKHTSQVLLLRKTFQHDQNNTSSLVLGANQLALNVITVQEVTRWHWQTWVSLSRILLIIMHLISHLISHVSSLNQLISHASCCANPSPTIWTLPSSKTLGAPENETPPHMAELAEPEDSWEDELEEHIMVGADIRWPEQRRRKNVLPLSISTWFFTTLQRYCKEIAQQWHKGESKYFAHHIQALARHIQTFELRENCGGECQSRSLLSFWWND
jgi:hypothetical protein